MNSAACQNKGFILEGFPRSQEDAKAIFNEKKELPKKVVEGEEAPAEGEEEPQFEYIINEKIVPQYAIALEADDASLGGRGKELPADQQDDARLGRRLKEYRGRNADDSGTTVKDFFTEAIGYPNVLVVDSMLPEGELLPKMKEIIEQKGKPCCINMITEEDNKFLANLEKIKQKELRAKAREAAAAEAEANPPAESDGQEPASNKDL